MTVGASTVLTMNELLGDKIHERTVAAWTLAALAVALRATDSAADEAACAVLTAAGLDVDGLDARFREPRAAEASGTLLKAAAIATGKPVSWADQSDEAIIAQGRASGMFTPNFLANLDLMPGMRELLAQPNAAILDVGVGIAGIAVSLAEALPTVRVVGIDVLPHVLALAAQTLAASPAGDRVELRLQSIDTLEDTDRYAFAWVPSPFIPEVPLIEGLRRVVRAVVPGGYVLLPHTRFDGVPLDDAVTRFQIASYGGTALDAAQAAEMLRAAGLPVTFTQPMPPGAPALAIGHRPAAG